jgi:hypothetical protein
MWSVLSLSFPLVMGILKISVLLFEHPGYYRHGRI